MDKKNYTAISIGPIGQTFAMARKPREFWAASYLYSYLMKNIVEKLSERDSGLQLISPAKPTQDRMGIGLYPDRAFFEGKINDLSAKLREIREKVARDLSQTSLNLIIDGSYFKILSTCVECASESEAIGELNNKLDIMELQNVAPEESAEREVLRLLQMENKTVKTQNYKSQWPQAFLEAFESGKWEIESLGEISSVELNQGKEDIKYREFRENLLEQDNNNDDSFKILEKRVKSYHKYFCIVQADGDNMGETIKQGNIREISEALRDYAQEITPKINAFGALPIYAGGDDLLFISPVVGKEGKNIFDLIKMIDGEFNHRFNKMKGNPSLSFGVLISYYKFPLFEAWKRCNDLLMQTAKNTYGKNAIAWELQKHSGSAFSGVLPKGNQSLYDNFEKLIAEQQSESIVSAVSHKLRANDSLLNLIKDAPQADARVDAFFEKTIGMSEAKKYKEVVREILKDLFKVQEIKQSTYNDMIQKSNNEHKEHLSLLAKQCYGMLRTAKFINGEEDKQ